MVVAPAYFSESYCCENAHSTKARMRVGRSTMSGEYEALWQVSSFLILANFLNTYDIVNGPKRLPSQWVDSSISFLLHDASG